jgi:hypothetical protein
MAAARSGVTRPGVDGRACGLSSGGTEMRTLIYTVGAVAVVLILLGLIIKAVKWLIILGLVALVASIVMGVIKGRQALR